jgi:hypothetical protein
MENEVLVKNPWHFIKAKSNRSFGPTGQEDSQPNGFERLGSREKPKDFFYVAIAVALI